MMTPEECTELSAHFSRLAEMARDRYSRYELQMLADSYMTLAKSAWTLERSGKALEALARHLRKEGRLS